MLRRRTVARLSGVCLVALLCLLPTGCIPYAYPHLMHVPSVSLPPTTETVHAFRVEGTGSIKDISHDISEYSLSRIELTHNRVPFQVDTSLDYGLYVVGIALNFPIHYGRTLAVRLYRRGFETIEMQAGESPTVAWKPVSSLKEREQAIDKLVSSPRLSCPFGFGWSRVELDPKWRSMNDALFVASEYRALADEAERSLQPEVNLETIREKAARIAKAAGVAAKSAPNR